MAKRQRTVQQLLDEVAEASDLPSGFTATSYITQTRAMSYLSQSVHAFAQKHRGFGLLATTGTINAVAGTKSYNLPDDFAALINLTTVLNSVPRKLKRADIDEIDLLPANGPGWQADVALYCILGDQIIVSDPKGSYSVQMRYVPELPMLNTGGTPIGDFSALTDYIVTKGTIDQWVIFDSAIRVARKQEKDPSAFLQARKDIEDQLVDNLRDRNEHDAGQVRDSWGLGSGYSEGDW